MKGAGCSQPGRAGRAQPLLCLNVLKEGKRSRAKGWRGAHTVGGSSHLERASSPVWRGCRGGAMPWWATNPGDSCQAGAGTAAGLRAALPARLQVVLAASGHLEVFLSLPSHNKKGVKATGKRRFYFMSLNILSLYKSLL